MVDMLPSTPPQGCFVTGTDTEIGKTRVSLAIMHLWRQAGRRVAGMKPVAAGVEGDPDGGNADALALRSMSSVAKAYRLHNPYLFREAIAPHLAAQRQGILVRKELILDARNALLADADALLVEGVGGWLVPLADDLDVARLAGLFGLPLVLVVGMRLGCLNHALLTLESLRRSDLPLLGWVANRVDPQMLCVEENIATLERLMPAPLLGDLPFLENPSAHALAAHLRADLLL
jgi:dethiobiotin synthetase